MLERVMREIRRRTRVVGNFPDVNSALMLVAARLRHVAGTKWGTRKYLDMDRLKELDRERAALDTELRALDEEDDRRLAARARLYDKGIV